MTSHWLEAHQEVEETLTPTRSSNHAHKQNSQSSIIAERCRRVMHTALMQGCDQLRIRGEHNSMRCACRTDVWQTVGEGAPTCSGSWCRSACVAQRQRLETRRGRPPRPAPITLPPLHCDVFAARWVFLRARCARVRAQNSPRHHLLPLAAATWRCASPVWWGIGAAAVALRDGLGLFVAVGTRSVAHCAGRPRLPLQPAPQCTAVSVSGSESKTSGMSDI